MDNPPRLEQGSAKTAPNASTLTTDEETRETNIQTPSQDSENIVEVQSNENASVSTSGTSADTDEAISATQHGCDNICCSVNKQDSQFSSPLKLSSNIEMSGGSRNQPSPNNKVIVSSVHAHNRKRGEPNNRMKQEIKEIRKRSKSEICGKSGKHLSTDSQQDMNDDKTLELNATSQVAFDNSALTSIDGQNIESNISISKTNQNGNAPKKISASIASKRGSIWSVDDILASPGTSSFHRNRNISNLCGEAFESFTCRVCNVAIAAHLTEGNAFKCCNCSYSNCEEVDLQIHSYTHVPKTTCDICEKEHAVGNSHNSEHRCPDPDCDETIQCRTLFYEHFLVHRRYFKKNCWVCRRKFEEHISTTDSSYLCCVCGFKCKYCIYLENHNELHLPRFYCKLCEEEYSIEEKRLHGRKFTCVECLEEFKCQNQLEEHYEDQHGYSPEKCRICKESKKDNFTITEGQKEFQCCKSECLQKFHQISVLLDHLSSHTGLRDYKCPICGRRFPEGYYMGGHKRNCKELSFKCELCETRFHSSDILREHFLVKHRHA